MDYYAKYRDAIAADHGVFAFFKWFLLSLLLHGVAVVPAIACLILAVMSAGEALRTAALVVFVVNVLAVRVLLFALPCAHAARSKGFGPRLLWGAAGFFFFSFALGLVAALPSRAEAAPPA